MAQSEDKTMKTAFKQLDRLPQAVRSRWGRQSVPKAFTLNSLGLTTWCPRTLPSALLFAKKSGPVLHEG